MKYIFFIMSLMMISSIIYGEDKAIPGELIQERPTLISLGFEWRVQGDDNGNATGKVQYRKKGEEKWREYLPLFRIGLKSQVFLAMACGWPQYVIPDALAGSIMDLEPGTDYEVRLEIQDPDGVTGEAVRILTVKTRAEPVVPVTGEVRHVYPPDWKGPKEKKYYRNIMEAVNGFAPISDIYLTLRPSMEAKPGTVIKMHGGLHKYDNSLYWKDGRPALSYWQHGTITLVAKGTKEEPIYIVPAGDGEVIIDGNGCHNLFNLRSTDYLHFEGLTIRGTDIAFHCGFQGLRGGGMKGLTVKNCWIEGVQYGILAQDGASQDFLIENNVILGRGPQKEMGDFGHSDTGYAVNLAGQGHIVCYNYVANFWDGINVFTGSHSDPQWGQQSRSIDFYNNDINNCADQFIEADGGYANLRMLRNRMFNCPSQPISCQPVHAGPVYWIRNILWRAAGGRENMKAQMFAQAYVFLHNTTSTHMSMMPNSSLTPTQGTWMIANNVALGPLQEKLPVVRFPAGTAGPNHVIHHNAYRNGLTANPWMAGKLVANSLEDFAKQTGYETGSFLTDFSVFEKAEEDPIFAKDKQFVLPQDVDLTPKADSVLVDAGIPIPGINDSYEGAAPDIGAMESGAPATVYGPQDGPYLKQLAEHIKNL